MTPKITARVLHAELWGTREGKYQQLAKTDASTTAWSELAPTTPFYWFVPRTEAHREEYDDTWRVTELLPVHGLGIQTSRDELVVGFTEGELVQRIEAFGAPERDDAAIRAQFFPGKRVRDYLPGDTRQWSLGAARNYLISHPEWKSQVQPCLYRPFDLRYVLYNRQMVDWPRPEVMTHMLQPNLGLLANRQSKEPFAVLCAKTLTERKIAAVYDASTTFPLYVYPRMDRVDLFDSEAPTSAPGGRRPNLAPKFIADFGQRLGMEWVADGAGDRISTFGPEDVFHYMYAIFHSPMYRERYAEFLKIDFPRLPLTTDAELFRRLCASGGELTGLHLMERHRPLLTRFPVAGDNTVDKVRYTEPGQGGDEGRVWINPNQYFDGVPPEVWEFHIGGYQVAEKWLKDRKGRQLSFDDLLHYQRVLAALARTQALMAEVDETVEEHGGWPLAGSGPGTTEP
jgi:predicted helicase